MSLVYIGYLCEKKSIKDIFYWSEDFNNLKTNGACKLKLYGECKDNCKPKKVQITVEEI